MEGKKHFLFRVAEAYYLHHKNSINRFTFVFPNRRAGIFFQQYLASVADTAFFSPQIITIEQWFESASDYSTADRLYQLFKLYELYIKKSNSSESFDNFAFWGEIILNDFNELDKYRVDAAQLFQNINDLKSIDELFDYISEEQLAAIRSFWKNFEPMPDKKNQQNFLATWKVLFELYRSFREALADEDIAYEGMLMREVTDKLVAGQFISSIEGKQFVFIGFNALNPCEKECMTVMQKLNQADFYWDYDADSLRDPENPASRFFKENLLFFPSLYDIGSDNHFISSKKFQLIKVPSGVGQAKEVFNILTRLYPENSAEESFLQTAVVLPDEHLLMPLLYSIPENIQKINVTMGYPMQLTPVAGLMDHIFEMHKRKKFKGNSFQFYHQNVINILHHQFISEIEGDLCQQLTKEISSENRIYIEEDFLGRSVLFKTLFCSSVGTENFLPYLKETLLILYRLWKKNRKNNASSLEAGFLYQYYSAVNRLQQLIDQQNYIQIVNIDTLIRIIRELTASITIPFVGEPLDGLQLMGVLETRGLDFRNIIICSFNEGIFPKKSFSNSFIPYHLRKGFGLPVFEQADAVTAYNFYRLLHHAENIYFLTDTRTEGGVTGEVSRFFYQLKYYYQVDIQVSAPVVNVSFQTPKTLSLTKDERLLKLLKEYTSSIPGSKALSASVINTYIHCPLKFCFSALEALERPEEIAETIENDTFGNIFHAVMAELYAPFSGRLITSELLNDLKSDDARLERLLSQAFGYYFYKKPKGTAVELEGSNLLIATVLKKYIKGVLNRDAIYAPFTYISGEKFVQSALQTRFGAVNLKGFIDRIDLKEDKLRILDYKTGGGGLDFQSWDAIFAPDIEPRNRPKHVLQTFLYGYLFKNYTDQKVISPGIYYTRKVFDEHFSTEISYRNEQNVKTTIENYYDFENEFIPRLRACVEEILDPSIPFVQTTVKENCVYCDYKSICKR